MAGFSITGVVGIGAFGAIYGFGELKKLWNTNKTNLPSSSIAKPNSAPPTEDKVTALDTVESVSADIAHSPEEPTATTTPTEGGLFQIKRRKGRTRSDVDNIVTITGNYNQWRVLRPPYEWINQRNNAKSNEGRNKSVVMNTEATYDELEIKRKLQERVLGLTDQEIPTCPGINGYLGNEQYRAIWDHSVKFFNNADQKKIASSGTGWIFDFELPETKDKYPLTWYFGTNLHVLKYVNARMMDSYPADIERNYEYGQTPKDKISPWFLAKARLDTDNKRTLPIDATDYVEAKEKQVAFVATSFLKDHPTRKYEVYNDDLDDAEEFDDNYYMDFGVLEVTFKNEEDAKKITNGWFTKYITFNATTGKYDKKADVKHINFDAQPLTKKTPDQLHKDVELFVGGYPASHKYEDDWKRDYWDVMKNQNFNINKLGCLVNPTKRTLDRTKVTISDSEAGLIDWTKGSKLSFSDQYRFSKNLVNEYGDSIIGLADSNTSRSKALPILGYYDEAVHGKFYENTQYWAKQNYFRWGLHYVVENVGLTGGSSGSMVIDQDLNFVGLNSMIYGGYDGFNHGITPIRSEEIWEYGRNIAMEYDFIHGTADKQTKSHRIFVEQFNKNTWFAQLYGWNVKKPAVK